MSTLAAKLALISSSNVRTLSIHLNPCFFRIGMPFGKARESFQDYIFKGTEASNALELIRAFGIADAYVVFGRHSEFQNTVQLKQLGRLTEGSFKTLQLIPEAISRIIAKDDHVCLEFERYNPQSSPLRYLVKHLKVLDITYLKASNRGL